MKMTNNNEKLMLTAEDVAEILQVKESCAYRIIRQMNTELAAMGKLVIRGRVNRHYFEKKISVWFQKKKGVIPLFVSKKSGRMLPPSDPTNSISPSQEVYYFIFYHISEVPVIVRWKKWHVTIQKNSIIYALVLIL